MFASTRIAVALCAAIAMVLGAMSVGATRHGDAPLADVPVGATGTTLANETSTSGSEANSPSNLPLGATYTVQQTLTTIGTPNQPQLLVNPRSPQIDVSLGPIKSLISEDKIKIDLDLPVPALVPLVTPIPVDASVSTDTSGVTEPPAGTTDAAPPQLQQTAQDTGDTSQQSEQLVP
jgi:hypothetical protein